MDRLVCLSNTIRNVIYMAIYYILLTITTSYVDDPDLAKIDHEFYDPEDPLISDNQGKSILYCAYMHCNILAVI